MTGAAGGSRFEPLGYGRHLEAARPVLHVLALLLVVLGVAMLLPAAVDLHVANPDWKAFVGGAAATLAFAATVALATRGTTGSLTRRQAFVLTVAAWTVLPMFGALPLTFGIAGIGFADAVFEAMSGLTTTGSTVLTGLDSMPPGLLLWRALLQWLGGIGIIAMATALLPYLRIGGMQLFRMESSDRSDKILPRPGQLASALLSLYVLLTVLCVFAFRAAGMGSFDAIAHAMTTVSTGGYSTSDASFGAFPPAAQVVATVFMLLGALPFVLMVQAGRGRLAPLWRSSQVRTFVLLLAIATLLMAATALHAGETWGAALRHAAFNVVSVVTTTGFASTDYQLWGPLAATFFFFLTFCGGCTGSTSGGVKVFRFQVLAKVLRQVVHRQVTPHGVFTLRYDGRPVGEDVVASAIAFIFAFQATVVVLALALAALGLDLVTAASAAVTAVANVGPGLGPIVGPAGNFATLPDSAKWLLSAGMLLGRLELFTVFVLLSRRFWTA